ncbi:glycolate reductase [Sphingobium sp. SYK-6]|uniref:NAD(P)-dependent oxidoreductase n=1 Tax=Sphingobium sp. (strain NBRC 103272 / SYK-6) TaxID=627192 RepID=UPI0002277551|nr:NAD(P)-dependent oxidoreductase [Sphingobium sp. SYK-6]BAK66101.1 glycolate reductase [Sphingobium sp. SYK-6]
MEPPAVLVTSPMLAARQADWNLGYRLITGDVTPEVAEHVEVVVSGDSLSNALIDSLPRLKLVACFSTGYSGIDLAHLRRRAIALTTAAGVNAHDVADHAMALLLGWWHGLSSADRQVRSGGWRDSLPPRSSLRGRRAGVVGLGRIGRAIAQRLQSHEMPVRWWGPRDKPDVQWKRAGSLPALAEWSDILIVASRADPQNAGQIDAAVLRALGPGGVLVNVSRGFLVDEDALIGALRDGSLGGAALDVFAAEPTDATLWSDVPNILLSPHIAGFTREAGADMIAQLRENVRRYFAGEPLLTPVEDAA